MNKQTLKDVVDQIELATSESSLTKGRIETILKQAFAYINTSVNAGDEVRINEFGTFKLKERPARKGRNPATGEQIDIPASRSVTFKAVKHGK